MSSVAVALAIISIATAAAPGESQAEDIIVSELSMGIIYAETGDDCMIKVEDNARISGINTDDVNENASIPRQLRFSARQIHQIEDISLRE
jgi:hypothetical protein